MRLSRWYELRIAGCVGTRAANGGGIKEGIAIGESGRLCSVLSGQAKKFETREQAFDFLAQTTLPRLYNFEPVLCQATDPGQSNVPPAAQARAS